ncbi:MAG: type I-E CRISPR-associated protein Cas6/Cse3/CasE [Clostridiales bacterium]|nr:type I-E CRISPR-associated protein Cas6/Cse3/CasE [Clostridiales bacterium]
MYLSRVEIDTTNRIALRALNHLGAYHNWVEQAFPDEVREETRSRKLWRIDRIEGKRYLLVVSETEPDCEQMEAYAVKGSFGCKNYEPFLQSIKQGECLRFRVTLNPVHSVFEENTKNRGKIYPIYSEAAQRKFFLDRAEKHGFSVDSEQFLIVERGEETLLRKGKKRWIWLRPSMKAH